MATGLHEGEEGIVVRMISSFVRERGYRHMILDVQATSGEGWEGRYGG